MAVYTKLSEKELKEFFSKYNLGKLLNYKEIKEGIENTNYFIQTEKGKFILTIYEKRVEEKDLPFFMGLMRNLFDANFPSPEPIINKNGNYITEISKKKAAVVSFLDGFVKKKLSPKENELLRLLALHENDLMPRELALTKIWRDDNYFTSRSMDVYIAKLRKYLKKDENVEILNIHGEGFRLVIKNKEEETKA